MKKRPENGSGYPLNQSPLFRLQTKRKLAALFGLKEKELLSLASRNDNYRVFQIQKNGPKPRTVEEPKPHLERIHRRLFVLLSRVAPPNYLHSGVKGRSYVTNASAHIGGGKLIKLDIKQFFPSTKAWHVFDFFHHVMDCSSDTAGVLASLCTCNGHVPTGSCLSQVLAYYAHYEMFERIYHIVQDEGANMTCYVDDITISGDAANRRLLSRIRKMILMRALQSHKHRIYRVGRPALVTGVIINGGGTELPKKRHKKIFEGYQAVLSEQDPSARKKKIESLLGRVNAATQIDGSLTVKRKQLAAQLRADVK